jgi:2-oxoglutarate dehydrogenase E1 component
MVCLSMSDGEQQSNPFEVSPANLPFVEELYLAYLKDPGSVDESWRRRFEAFPPQDAALFELPPAPNGAYHPGNGHGEFGGNGKASAPAATKPHNGANGTASAAQTPATFSTSAVVAARPATRTPVSSGPGTSLHDGTDVGAVAARRAIAGKRVRRLIEDYREIGHLAATLDPLGLEDRRANRIRLEDYGLSASDLDDLVEADGIADGRPIKLRELLDLLEETYCRNIGIEVSHIYSPEIRSWLQQRIESTRNRVRFTRAEQLHMLGKVTEAEVFEQFLQTKFLGAKRFSLEGAESIIPVLDRVIERASRAGVSQIVIGMAHRGRLNVLSNVLGKPPAEIFAEFLDRTIQLGDENGGDVKYHLGYSSDKTTASGRVHISLSFNPSHLEAVNTVVQGRLRAKQDRISDEARTKGLPIILHGDAAFAGQGVVAEALNMSGLDTYNVGGTIHLVINNQIGFTTSPKSAYSTVYSTDVARMLQTPIIHINGEDPEAVAQAVDLAVDFRQTFHRDVVVDMWCYRKLGHNETDEPTFTQPVMYKAIATHPAPRQIFLERLAAMNTGETPVTAADVEAITAQRKQSLEEALDQAKKFHAPPRPSTFAGVWSSVRGGPDSTVRDVSTAVSGEALAAVGQAISSIPPEFTPHPKLVRLLKDRGAMALGQKPVDWGCAEALAFGTLVGEGVRIRFSGQDVRRGTFSHRHAVLIDYVNNTEYTPLAHVAPGQGTFEIRDSALSEAGALGFEYGYSLDMPEGLVLWEAQFGDFVNGAQVIIDQFLVSSEAKWNRVSGLVMLLPHGMEGQGPEHSSARLERFLNEGVNDNIQVCNVTTPAQLFHLLRRQVMRPYRKPLIVMSPKSMLRHPAVISPLEDFTKGSFRHVIADTTVDPKAVDRIVLCTGKVYYDLAAAREATGLKNVAIIRIEQLYPLRTEEVLDALSVYKEGIRAMWVQEEPRNMGAWNFVNRVLPPLLASAFRWSGVSRPFSASPATGSLSRHNMEHAKLLEEALGIGPGSIVIDKGQIKKGSVS